MGESMIFFPTLLSKVVLLLNIAQLRAVLLYVLDLGLYSRRKQRGSDWVPL